MGRREFALSPRDQRPLESLVDRIEQHVRALVAADPPAGRIAAWALLDPNDAPRGYFPDCVACLTSSERDEILTADIRERAELMWNANWQFHCFSCIMAPETPHDIRLWDIIAEHPEQDQFEWVDPTGWIHQIVCRRIAHRPPPCADPLFTCFVATDGLDDYLDATLLYASPPATYAELDRLGLLPRWDFPAAGVDTDEAELEFPPRPAPSDNSALRPLRESHDAGVPLARSDQALLDNLLDRLEKQIRSTLGHFPLPTLAAVALGFDVLSSPYQQRIAVIDLETWNSRLRIADIEERFKYIWTDKPVYDLYDGEPTRPGWPIQLAPQPMELTADDRCIWNRLVDQADEDDLDWPGPTPSIAQTLCRRLSYNPPAGTAPNFICISSRHPFDHQFEAMLRYAAPPHVAAELDRHGLLSVPPALFS